MSAIAPTNPRISRPIHRWTRRLLILVVLAVALYLARGSLLRWFAGVLVSEDPPAPTAYLAVMDGDRRLDEAARLYRLGPVQGVLLIEPRPSRLVKSGIVPAFPTLDRQGLETRGIPAAVIELLPGEARSPWEKARLLRGWLQRHPGAEVLVLCDRFGSRCWRHILDAELGDDLAGRVRFYAIPHRAYNETDWWQRKEGILSVFHNSLRLSYTGLYGEEKSSRLVWDPDAYEKSLDE